MVQQLFRGIVTAALVVCPLLIPAPATAFQQTVIPGTHRWDADTGKPGGAVAGPDFLWEHTVDGEAFLRPLEGVETAIVKSGQPFSRVDKKTVAAQALAEGRAFPVNPPEEAVLAPGTVLVFKTSEGRLGKLEIVGFKDSHDFNFEGAESLPEKWKELLRAKPVKERYHLVVRWALFE